MTKSILDHNLNWLLLRSSFIAKQRLMKISEDRDMAPMQVLALCLLEPGKSAAMSLLSDMLLCDPSNVTGIVERLSVGGFIERRECATDRRVKVITLTATGEKLRDELIHELTEEEAPHLAVLTEGEKTMLREILIKTLPQPTAKHYPNTKEA